jgi:hypothetical protein
MASRSPAKPWPRPPISAVTTPGAVSAIQTTHSTGAPLGMVATGNVDLFGNPTYESLSGNLFSGTYKYRTMFRTAIGGNATGVGHHGIDLGCEPAWIPNGIADVGRHAQ